MRQGHYCVSLGNKQLRGVFGDHYIVLPSIKVKKADVEKILVNGVLLAGTLLTKEGKPVTTTNQSSDVFGVNYTDVDFNNCIDLNINNERTCTVSIFVHGTLNAKYVKFDRNNADVEYAVLSDRIVFLGDIVGTEDHSPQGSQEPQEPQVDKTNLRNLYNNNLNKEESKYTVESFSVFNNALQNANAILNKENATQNEVDSAYQTLNNAISGLVVKPTTEPGSNIAKVGSGIVGASVVG